MTLFLLVVFSTLHLFLDPSSVSSMPFPAELVLERESKVYFQRERESFSTLCHEIQVCGEF